CTHRPSKSNFCDHRRCYPGAGSGNKFAGGVAPFHTLKPSHTTAVEGCRIQRTLNAASRVENSANSSYQNCVVKAPQCGQLNAAFSTRLARSNALSRSARRIARCDADQPLAAALG